jgi:hypothetical protein
MSKRLLALVGALALVGTTVADVEARPRKKSSSSSSSASASSSSSKTRKKKRVKKVKPAAVETAGEVKPKPPDEPSNPEQAAADRHFKSGVTLYKEAKFAEALAEFERAYETAPHPLVLYNIAGCHRELSNYAESVKYSRRFLEEGKGMVSKARLTAAQNELDAVLARIARVSVTVAVEGAELIVDGVSLGTFPLDMPLILPPGEHRIVARAEGFRDAERSMRLASGDELEVALTLAVRPPEPVARPERIVVRPPDDGDGDDAAPRKRRASASRKRFSLGGGYASNLRDVENTGAGTARLAMRMGSRLELGVEGVFVAYAVVPSLRLRLFGDTFSAHLIGAAPVAIKAGAMEETFVSGAGGLGLRLRLTDSLAVRLEGYYSYAGKTRGTTYPAFVGGELWF